MTRLLNVVFFCALAMWLGISIARLVVGYDAFVPGTTQLKDWYSVAQTIQVSWLYTQLAAWSGWSFGVMLVGGLGYLLASRGVWKHHGWLLMVLIFLILLVPGQVWLVLEDVRLWELYNSQGQPAGDADALLRIFVQRMTGMAFSVVNGMSILMGLTIAATIAFRPLTNTTSPDRES